jgi:hypothetical protein
MGRRARGERVDVDALWVVEQPIGEVVSVVAQRRQLDDARMAVGGEVCADARANAAAGKKASISRCATS